VRTGPGRAQPGPGRAQPGPGRAQPGPGRAQPGPGRAVPPGRAGCRGGLAAGGGPALAVHGGQDIGAGDASAHPGAVDLGRVQSVLVQQPADHGREDAVPGSVIGRACLRRGRGRGCRRRGGCRGRRSLLGRRRLGCRLGGLGRGRGFGGAGAAGLVADHGQAGADVDCLAFGDQDLGQEAGSRGRHLGVNLVGGDLEEDLIGLDPVSYRLGPAGDGPLGDRLSQLGHRHVGHQPCNPLPVRASIVSPNTSERVG